ncbi:hypothetical protein [Aestuariivirga sp.]|uniref:hypothetical protein n=1 Tax=Aestuariivirga sp. TaxID=2650926 RepID=UPI003593961E
MLKSANHSTCPSVQPALMPKDIMNDVDLCVWVAEAKPGDRIVYYRGHLSRDRQTHGEGYPEPVRRKIGEIGNCAWMLADEHWVHLMQKRIGIGFWEYIAVRKAETPKLKPVYRVIQSLASKGAKEKRDSPAGLTATVNATGPPG